MYCYQCGEKIENDQKFCTKCGAPVYSETDMNNPLDMEDAQPWKPVTMEVQPAPDADKVPLETTHRKIKTWCKLLIIAGSVMIAAGAILVPVLMEKARYKRYEAAVDMMDSGDYNEAKAEFDELGEYKNSISMAEDCQDTMDYNAAQEKMDAGEYEEARQAFAALGNFEDADSLAAECQNIIDYNAATALMEAGSNEEARDSFLALGDYQDAKEQAAECQRRLDYAAAAVLMESEDYAAAKEAFEALSGYSDADAMALECGNHITYNEAESAFADGQYYTAYKMFTGLGSFEDAADRAAACVQPAPENGELYHNPDFAKRLSLTIKNKGKAVELCAKVYSEDDELVSIIYVAPGKKVKIKLQKGDYTIHVGWGTQWFGEDDYFGEDAFYSYGNDGMLFTISSGYYYTYELTTPEADDVERGSLNLEEF